MSHAGGEGSSILLDGVTFRYAGQHADAVRDLSWTIGPGRTAVLGPNGAGKSTVLQLIAGLLTPRRGKLTIGGRAVHRRARLGADLGYLPQDVPAVRGMTVRDQVGYHLWLSGGPTGRRSAGPVDEALSKVNLERLAAAESTSLSGGERRRLGIACAMVHQPSILLLDEPSAGLDPLEREAVDRVIATALSARTVIVTTHQTESLSQAFDSVAIFDEGTVVEHQAVEWFLAQPYVDPGNDWLSIYRHHLTGAAR